MTAGIVFTLICLIVVERYMYSIALYFDYFGKVKNKELIELCGIKKILFRKETTYNLDKKNYVSKSSFVFQIINYVYVIISLIIPVIFGVIFPENLITVGSVIGLLICGALALITSVIMTFIAAANEDRRDKKNKEAAEKNQSNSSRLDRK